MYIAAMRTALKLDLKDGATLWSESELDRCVTRAVADLSRFLPLEKVYEKTLVFAVTSEAWTAAAAAGTYVALANKPIKQGSEAVVDDAAAACVRDTDYTIDYSNGEITHISGGKISNNEVCAISYVISQVEVDLASLTDFIRLDRVEYPYGKVPQKFISPEIFNMVLLVGSSGDDSQAQMAANEHIAVRYFAEHTIPAAAANGSYPLFLDNTVILAAGAYALFIKALQHEHFAVTDLASMRTELGLTTAVHSLITTALAKIATYLETNANNSAKIMLTEITTQAADLRTAVKTAVDAANAYADTVASDLTTGAALINAANVGADVAGHYGRYAEARGSVAMTYINEALARISNLRTYIEQAAGWGAVARGFIDEAVDRLAQVDRYLTEAAQYERAAGADIILADLFRREAIERRNEAWGIWRDRGQYIGDTSTVALRQPR